MRTRESAEDAQKEREEAEREAAAERAKAAATQPKRKTKFCEDGSEDADATELDMPRSQ